jgi:uncharacterized membrane protein
MTVMPLAITSYEWFLSFHVLAAVIWVGGGVTLHLLFHRIDAEAEPARAATMMSEAGFIGNRVFAPSSVVLLVMGFILMGKGDWDYDFWVLFGLAVWLFSFVVGAGYFSRKAGPLAEGLATQGWTPDVAAMWRPFRRLGAIETWLLVLAVLDMALKPGA